MHQKIMRAAAKLSAWALGIGILILIIIPPALYVHTTRKLVDELPQKEISELDNSSTLEVWKSVEKCKPEECASITPYWIYRWITVAMINDFITPIDLSHAYGNTSKMAGVVAINWMRSGHFKGKGMLWWHLTHAFLGIYIQRNWSSSEIASTFSAINA